MTGAMQMMLGNGLARITVPTDWGGSSGPSPLTSATKTLSIAANNPGNIRFHIVFAPSGTPSYIKNGAAAVTITQDMVVNFANNDTLAFKLIGPVSDALNIQAIDNTVQLLIGTVGLTIT